MTLKEVIGSVIVAIATSAICGSFVAYIALKDVQGDQKGDIRVLDTRLGEISSKLDKLDGRLSDFDTRSAKWDESSVIVKRHDDYLKQLVNDLNDMIGRLSAPRLMSVPPEPTEKRIAPVPVVPPPSPSTLQTPVPMAPLSPVWKPKEESLLQQKPQKKDIPFILPPVQSIKEQ